MLQRLHFEPVFGQLGRFGFAVDAVPVGPHRARIELFRSEGDVLDRFRPFPERTAQRRVEVDVRGLEPLWICGPRRPKVPLR